MNELRVPGLADPGLTPQTYPPNVPGVIEQYTTTMSSGYTFILATWRNDAADIRAVREQVWEEVYSGERSPGDGSGEELAFHVLAYDAAGRAVGAARMQEDGRIDYVLVRKPWRGDTVGGALLAYLVHIAQARRLENVWSIVPPSVQRFFAKNLFVAAGNTATDGAAGQRWVRRVPMPGERNSNPQ